MKRKLFTMVALLLMAVTSAYSQSGNDAPFRITALEDNVTVELNLHQGASDSNTELIYNAQIQMEYSTDGINWSTLTIGNKTDDGFNSGEAVAPTTITLQNQGDYICFRRVKGDPAEGTFSGGYYRNIKDNLLAELI